MGGKQRVNISLDSDIYQRARELGLNVSGVAERALAIYIQRLEASSTEHPEPSAVLGRADPFGQPADQPTESSAESSSGDSQPQPPARSVDEILDEYETYATTVLDRKLVTVEQHCRYIERLLRHTDSSPQAITEDDIVAYIQSEEPMSNSKHQNILSALRVFFGEFVETDVVESFSVPSTSPSPTTVPTKPELQTFYAELDNLKHRTIFLMYATSGLRASELAKLTMDDIDEGRQMLTPDTESSTKQSWVSFYNDEAQAAFDAFKPEREAGDDRAFQASKPAVTAMFQRYSENSGVKVTAQMLRRWFASEMTSLGVDSSYIDAFCGRTPDSVLEKHYLDYSPRKLKEIYDNAGLTVLE